MSEIAREIGAQPELWRRAAELAAGSAAQALPAPGTRVAVVGCGTSWFVAQAVASLREEAGHGETDAFTPSEMPTGRSGGYGHILAISRSGTTSEVVRLLGQLGEGTPSTAVCAVDATPVVEAAGRSVILDFADERSIVQTSFATTALALLRAHFGHDLEAAAIDADRALRMGLPIDPSAFGHFVFLGHGWTVGLASEAALKLREAAQAWTESYPAMEYRHGPISVAGPSSVVWSLGEVDRAVLEDAAATGATVVRAGLDPMAELILVQRTAVALAEDRGLDPDRPRHLTRSVVLS